MTQTALTFPDRNKGYICPCCNQFVKTYTRSFNSNMAVALLFLYRKRDKGFIHLENSMKEDGYKRCGDSSYLRHYGLIEPLLNQRVDGSSRNGYYKITGRGILFAENKDTAPKTFSIFNNTIQGFSSEVINIIQALGNKFKYSELMNTSTVSLDTPIN